VPTTERARRGPGPVATVHRILIASALACALVYAAWSARQWTLGAGPLALVSAAIGLAGAGGIGLYLRSLRGLDAKLTATDPTDRPT
jgi:hypothetical protein